MKQGKVLRSISKSDRKIHRLKTLNVNPSDQQQQYYYYYYYYYLNYCPLHEGIEGEENYSALILNLETRLR